MPDSSLLILAFIGVFAAILFTLLLCARSSQRKHFATRYWLDEEKCERRQSKHARVDSKHDARHEAPYAHLRELMTQQDRVHDMPTQPTYAYLQSSPRRATQRLRAMQLLPSSQQKSTVSLVPPSLATPGVEANIEATLIPAVQEPVSAAPAKDADASSEQHTALEVCQEMQFNDAQILLKQTVALSKPLTV